MVDDPYRTNRTPVPTNIIIDLTESVSKLDGKVGEGFESIKERISTLESKPGHSCMYPEEISHARDIPAVKSEVKGLTKWRWWLMGTVGVVAAALVSFVIFSRVSGAETNQRVNTLRDDVDDLDEQVDDLDSQLHKTQITIVREIRTQSQATRSVVDGKVNGDEEEDEIRIEPDSIQKLRPYERRQLHKLLEKIE